MVEESVLEFFGGAEEGTVPLEVGFRKGEKGDVKTFEKIHRGRPRREGGVYPCKAVHILKINTEVVVVDGMRIRAPGDVVAGKEIIRVYKGSVGDRGVVGEAVAPDFVKRTVSGVQGEGSGDGRFDGTWSGSRICVRWIGLKCRRKEA